MTCPRCLADVDQDPYGPCASCVAELVQMEAPRPDPNFVDASKMDGAHYVVYVGPLVDRGARR